MKIKCITNIIVGLVFVFSASGVARADTIIMRSGQRINGVVVEEYTDRLVISTIDGEQTIMREDIRRTIYDLEEQNMVALGEYYLDQGQYSKAYYYFSEALEINPDYERARDGLSYAGSYLQQKERLSKLRHMERLEQGTRWGRGITVKKETNVERELRETLGLVFNDPESPFKITGIVPGSPASQTSLLPGDVLASCWGRYVKYMRPEDVYSRLVRPGAMEVKMTVERDLMIQLGRGATSHAGLMGVDLGYDMMSGLIIEGVREDGPAERAGLRPGDAILEIQGYSTRYMPENELRDLVTSRAGDSLSLKIERAETVWKSFTGTY